MFFVGKQRYIVILFLVFAGIGLFGQEEVDFEDLLIRVDTIENPVYLPLVSIEYGPLFFMGDVDNASRSPIIGNSAIKANVTTFIDNKHFIAASFSYMNGTLYGDQRSIDDPRMNLNFKSAIKSFGASVRYEFGHLLPEELLIRPFISLGVAEINFETYGDLKNAEGDPYNYWSDGTIRNISETSTGGAVPLIRDYVYETHLKTDYILGIPMQIGFTLEISPRVFFSLGTEYHYTFTDYIDNVASEGDKAKDGFLYTSASLKFDLFSDPATRTVELLYADYDMNYMIFEDEDGDMVLDNADHCPGTPYGVLVDTLGCPFDQDMDGVPDYMDKEMDTPKGAWVDDEGVSIKEEEFLARLHREKALKREDLDLYMELYIDKFTKKSIGEIPKKFEILDTDKDGYISFDELLKVIDAYFDYKVNLSLEEVREVNEYFFAQ